MCGAGSIGHKIPFGHCDWTNNTCVMMARTILRGGPTLLDRFAGELNERQAKILNRVLREGLEGIMGDSNAVEAALFLFECSV